MSNNVSKVEKLLIYIVTVIVIGLVSYIFLKIDDTVNKNSNRLVELSDRLAKLEGAIGILSSSASGSSNISNTELSLMEFNIVKDIKFKVVMTNDILDKVPSEIKTEFSLSKDNRMYVYATWIDLIGEHRVVVKWITPNRTIYSESVYETNFENQHWNTWHWQHLYKELPKGTWYFEIYLDGKLLSTKSFKIIS